MHIKISHYTVQYLKQAIGGFAQDLGYTIVANRILFGGNLLRQPVFVQLKKDRPNALRAVGEMIGADAIMHQAIFLGTYPGLTSAMLAHEIAVIREFIALKR